jgi:hypothetical protein
MHPKVPARSEIVSLTERFFAVLRPVLLIFLLRCVLPAWACGASMQDGSQVQENASLRKELQDCQGKLQKSAAGNLDPGFLEEQQRLREQEAAAKAKLHAAATPENLADWRGHLPPGPAAVPVTAQQQAQAQQQQAQAQQQQPQQQPQQQQQQQQQQQEQEQAKQDQVQEPPQQAVQAPGTQAPTQVKAPGNQLGVAAPGGQQPQDQKPQVQQPQATPGEETKPAGKHNHMSVTERLRDARVRRRRQRAQRAKQHTLSQLEQALGHAAAEDEEESGGDVEEEEEGIEQHPERNWP